MIYCANHKDREAAYHCHRCEKGFCEECIREREFHKVRMCLCALCDSPVTRLKLYRLVRPFWKELPSVLLFPFSGHGWFLLGAWVVLATALLGTAPFMVALDREIKYLDRYNAAGFLFYFVVMIAIVYRIIVTSIDGEMKFPKLNSHGNLFERLGEMLPQIFGPFLGLFWPIIVLVLCTWSAYNQDPSPTREFLLLLFPSLLLLSFTFGLFLLPMAFLVMAVFHNFLGIFNVFFIYRQIRLIRGEYIVLWLALLILGGIYGFARFGLRTVLLPLSPPLILACYALDGFMQIWLALVIAHLLGRLYYQNRFKLAWFPECKDAPDFLVNGKIADMLPDDPKLRTRMAGPSRTASGAIGVAMGGTALNAGRPEAPLATAPGAEHLPAHLEEKIKHGKYLSEHGSYDQALEVFREVLAEAPDNFTALSGLARAGFKLGDSETVCAAGKKLGSEFAQSRAFETLWDMYQDYKREIPAFTFEPAELLALSRWLETTDNHLEAARLLRELAVTAPDSEEAPGALLYCGELLEKKCGLADKAASVWKALVERYPESRAAGKARELLTKGQ